MASQEQVRQYLAHWFQLGKQVWINNGQAALLPQSVISGDRYSPEFEVCWQQVMSPESGECYLDGTSQTIAELLSPAWEISSCGRCAMPIPVASVGMPALNCPCIDLPLWPNTELPKPRLPISNQTQLSQIRDRLLQSIGKSTGNAQQDSP
ncbi:MAG: hypothetical protein HC881_00485 [Leptolyngbyaceae cyanobacterium SL_7_1]|nr:hypothetical protein [Leptolyngbyaceae cyanobacterium SL_7_1]